MAHGPINIKWNSCLYNVINIKDPRSSVSVVIRLGPLGFYSVLGRDAFQSIRSVRPIKAPIQWVPIKVFLARTTASHLVPTLIKNVAMPPKK